MKKPLILLFCIASMSGPGNGQAYDFSAIDSLISANLESVFSGGVVCLVNKDDQPIYVNEAGNLTRQSAGAVASVTKTFSASLILALCDEGIITLDDSVGKYLPSFTRAGKNKFTFRQCFSHTAGWGSADDSGYQTAGNLTLQQAADSMAAHYDFLYEPGTAFCYGGVSMQIAGAMAEVAAGARWVDMFKSRVADKCSLVATTFSPLKAGNPMIAGGLRSSADDMMKLASMILHKGVYRGTRVVSEAMMEEMWKDQTHRVPQISSPYPSSPPWNNPYDADTVYYGVGDWLDICNPATGVQEQISGDGAFGSILWIDRCRGITGVFYTQSLYGRTFPVEYRIMDIVRNAVGGGCPQTAMEGNRGSRAPAAGLRIAPNPFNPGTLVRYDLERDCAVELSVFDARGQKVEDLVRGRQNAGAHEAAWRPSKCPGGVYIVRLRAGGLRMTRKALLVR